MTPRVLIAGIGNIFFGDDGFGVELARRLANVELPERVRVADYGISGMHLAYDLVAGYDTTILLDATCRGERPGTISIIELDHDAEATEPVAAASVVDAHGMRPESVLALVTMLGGELGRVLLVGCEPEETGHGLGLSPTVAAAVERAIPAVLKLARAEVDRMDRFVDRMEK